MFSAVILEYKKRVFLFSCDFGNKRMKTFEIGGIFTFASWHFFVVTVVSEDVIRGKIVNLQTYKMIK